jgi:putative methyltransferase (TIGR04325 family)
MKALVRDIIAQIPGVREWVAKKIFLGANHNHYRFLGVYSSQAEAKAHIPREVAHGFDDPSLSETFDESVPPQDEPVVKILSRLMPEIKTIFDLGGCIGFCFYRYRSRMTYPSDLRWIISDVPFVNKLGRQIAEKRGETQLFFTENPAVASGSDVYLTTGALQFFDESLADILAKLEEKPKHVLINRVPMIPDKSTFFTLQHTDYSVVPYRIANIPQFVSEMAEIGYELVEQWEVDRFCEIILHPERYVRNYYGFYFVRI